MQFFAKRKQSKITGSGNPETGVGASGISDKSILGYIEGANLTEKMLVNAEGDVIVIAGSVDGRYVRTLCSMIAGRQDRSPDVREVTPFEFDQIMQAINKQKSSSLQVESPRTGNDTVQYVLDTAIEKSTSDVYLDIRDQNAELSFRIHGQVKKIQDMDADKARNVARGLFNKAVNAQWEEKTPCDTSFSHNSKGRLYRVRVNSLPDTRGQSLSLRIRDPKFILPLVESGYSDHQVSLIHRICKAPGGLILITGETNSGKSTTLAGLMETAPRGERMIEIADPVEVEMDHCTHVEIDRYADNSQELFRRVLAATVRQNPDTLVLGEIRDVESADAAQNMAIQGKRVLSTLHTQSCTAAIPRLENLGVDRHLLKLREFIAGIVNQNLVPVICSHCGLDQHPDAKENERYQRLFDGHCRFINHEGCEACVSGVSGQTLVAEVFPLTLDRNRAHQIIGDQELWKLQNYMVKEFSIETKQDHARGKVLAGMIDPDRTEAIIGEWVELPAKKQPARARKQQAIPLGNLTFGQVRHA
ncbi:MAG: ATPase, T2SS/T4P/T4SS family [Gammaproteobacteria bacterium]|nr:ATPase, T2SS/T4P/T4SS family [Gammaproteobacteria bacterium]